MSMQFSVLASGSTGNAIYVETEEHSFLVDAGLSGKQMANFFSKLVAILPNLMGSLSHMNTVIILKELV